MDTTYRTETRTDGNGNPYDVRLANPANSPISNPVADPTLKAFNQSLVAGDNPASSTVLSNYNYATNTKPGLDSTLVNLSNKGTTLGPDGIARSADGSVYNTPPAPVLPQPEGGLGQTNTDGTAVNPGPGYTLSDPDASGAQHYYQYSDDPLQERLYQSMIQNLDANTKSQVESVTQQYNVLKAQQAQNNKATEAGATQALLLGKSARYAPLSSDSEIELIKTNGLQEIAHLDATENSLIAAAKSAQASGNQKVYQDAIAGAQKVRENKQAAAQKLSDELSTQIQQQKKDQIQMEAQNKKDMQNAYSDAINAGADPETLASAKTPQELLAVAAPFLKQKQELDSQLKKAQIASVYSKIQPSTGVKGEVAGASTYNGTPLPTGMDSPTALAYAQQYASDGKIPAGIPKGSFGAISAMAKDLPQADGAIVDNNTGVKSGKLPASQADAYGALRDLTQKIDQAETLFKQIHSGILSPALGIFPSTERQAFNTLSDEIVDLLARARTGAAISANEEAMYRNKIPSTWNQAFGFGTSGESKFEGLKSSISNKLDSSLRANGVSMYGFSKVKLSDGNEYTVGQVIGAPDGAKGRINADGSITPLQ